VEGRSRADEDTFIKNVRATAMYVVVVLPRLETYTPIEYVCAP